MTMLKKQKKLTAANKVQNFFLSQGAENWFCKLLILIEIKGNAYGRLTQPEYGLIWLKYTCYQQLSLMKIIPIHA